MSLVQFHLQKCLTLNASVVMLLQFVVVVFFTYNQIQFENFRSFFFFSMVKTQNLQDETKCKDPTSGSSVKMFINVI